MEFKAYNLKNWYDISYGEILEFESTYYNSGGDYNNHTGMFTCSVPGLYYFSATLSAWDSDRSHPRPSNFAIVTEDFQKSDGYSYSDNTGNLNFKTVHLVYHLSQGDRVWVQNWNNSAKYTLFYNHFTGVLISPDVNEEN